MTPFMESQRLWFRAVELTDVPVLAGWINDERVRKHLDHRVFPMSLNGEEEWVRRVTALPPGAPSEVVFVFGPKGGDTPIGTCGLMGIHWISREAELGIMIGEPATWDLGYGREATKRIVDYAFIDLNLNRVKLRVNDANARGRRAYEAIGFVHEGTLREATWCDGKHEDIHVMSVLRREWTPGFEHVRRTKRSKKKTA